MARDIPGHTGPLPLVNMMFPPGLPVLAKHELGQS
jgi:hypothetical protein